MRCCHILGMFRTVLELRLKIAYLNVTSPPISISNQMALLSQDRVSTLRGCSVLQWSKPFFKYQNKELLKNHFDTISIENSNWNYPICRWVSIFYKNLYHDNYSKMSIYVSKMALIFIENYSRLHISKFRLILNFIHLLLQNYFEF